MLPAAAAAAAAAAALAPLNPEQPRHHRAEAERAKSEASRVLREKEALRERVAALQSAADRSEEAAEAALRERDEARVAAATAAQRAQQERDGLAEMEGENEGLQARLQMAEDELGVLAAAADQVNINLRVWCRLGSVLRPCRTRQCCWWTKIVPYICICV